MSRRTGLATEETWGLSGRESGEAVPLLGVSVEGDLTGRSARVEVTQVFENREKNPIEAVYRFPLPEGAALVGFRAVVGDRVFTSEVDERDKAFERYDRALEAGHGAFLLDEERPNIFTLSVGNLNPGARATITLTYAETLEARGQEVRFSLPTTISPRYCPAGAPDEDGIPAPERVHPEYADRVPYGLSLRLRVHGGSALESVESPSHPVRCRFGDDPVVVELTSETTVMDRDFVLVARAREDARSRGWLSTVGDETFLQVDFAVPEVETSGQAPATEVVFLLDCSGSMQGSSIAEARRALEIFVRGLPAGTRFNLYRFGSTHERLWPEGRPADAANTGEALAYLKRVDANLGGTELLAPLQEIYAQPPRAGRRDVVLVTDGQIGNESEVFELLRSGAGRVRLFTVGIGHGPNDYLVRQAARTSGGTSVLVAPGERIEPRILGLFGQVFQPGLEGLRLAGVDGAEQAPSHATAFPGDTVSLFARWPNGREPSGAVTLTATAGGKPFQWTIPVSAASESAAIAQLWAREAIRDLEEGTAAGSRQEARKRASVERSVVELSRRYGVASRHTSFVVVEERQEKDRTTGEVLLRKVPVPVTRGWHGAVGMECLCQDAMAPSPPAASQARLRRQVLFDASPVFGDSCFEASRSIGGAPERWNARERADDYQRLSDDGLLLALLSAQRAEGGFALDELLARALGFVVSDLRQLVGDVSETLGEERFVLLCTGLVLAVLEHRFRDRSEVWAGVTAKTRNWYRRVSASQHPTVRGVPLEEWAGEFLRTHGP